MPDSKQTEELVAQAADAVRRVIAAAEERAAEIVREAEAQAAGIRERAEADAGEARKRAEADARQQIEAAKRALDELGGTLAAAASAAVPRAESEPPVAAAKEEPPPGPEPDPEPVEPEQATDNGGDAAVRLVAMKLAVEGKDPATIEAELIERFGPGDRAELLKEILARVAR